MSLPPQFRVYIAFFLFAMSTGSLFSRLPDLQAQLSVNKAELGLTLIGMAIGSLISLTFSSPLIVKLGTRATLAISLLGVMALLSTIPLLQSASLVFCVLFCMGLLAGALEICLNVEIGRLEAQIGFGIMNRAHGCWSLGFFVTAVTASLVRQAGIGMQMHMHLLLGTMFVIGAVIIAGMKNAPHVTGAATTDDAPHFALPTLALLPLCIIGTSAFLIEGAGIDWSTIYMDEVFDVSPFISGSGLTLFAFFMALARLTIDPVMDRHGARLVGRVLLAIAAIGIALVWLAPHPYAALLGFALMGGGCSAVYPMAVSAAAQRTDRPAVINVAAIAQMAFVVFFLGPPLLGFVAESFGIRNAYFLCLPLILGSIFASAALPAGPARRETVVA
ncbi:MFS transporter [Peteryoungia ipomoeae]|uniref:MFS transporter n=1 Tax=Peteryoungia ipomoeae TaxID=1210932 RepID=A0A4S8NZC7_9HYPH|nr:MFS transporter [Peteryoungia ipomoeae]THV23090.1 MFS transporter [Peteryoungia ipomoeae]